MPNGFFNFFSGKDDTPPAPEGRRVPWLIEDIPSPDDKWITTQVFINKKDKNGRIYYAARYFEHYKNWEIEEYSYSTKDTGSGVTSTTLYDSLPIDRAIQILARLEQVTKNEDGLLPVPGLKGNYREVANLHSAYIDDKGNYISVVKDKPLAKDATFNRKGIQALYSKATEKPAEPFIKTWDDFYRVIVNKYPPEALTRAPLPDWFVKSSRGMMEDIKALVPKIRDPQASLQEKLLARNYAHCGGVRIDDFPEAQYAYHVMQLTALMRAGNEVFRQLTASVSRSEENMLLLEEVGKTIRHFVRCQHEKDFAFSREQAEQLVNLMMQGPDPYADKPLPLEVFLDKYKNQLPPAAKSKPENPVL
jgi:hypothetical protein